MNSSKQIHLPALFLLAVVCYYTFFYGLAGYPLWDPDEGRSGVIAKEMLESGNWLTLTHNGAPYYDKPALYFWLVGAASKLFHLSEFTIRLPSALAATLTVGTVYLCGFLLGGWRVGLWGALVLATSVEFMALGRFGKMDMLFTFFFSAALFYFLWWKQAEQRATPIWPFYFFLALASLSKGPVGLLLPLLIVAIALGSEKRWDLLTEMRLIQGMMIFVLVSGSWYLPAAIRDPNYIKTFLWDHNVLRFFTVREGIAHAEPMFYFLPVLLGGFLPWSLFLVPVLHDLWERRRMPQWGENLFLAIWAATVLVFFSLSRNKLGTYILPAFPPLALLTGQTLSQMTLGDRSQAWKQCWLLYGSILWLFLLFSAFPISEWFLKPRYPEYFTTEPPYIVVALFLLGGALLWLTQKERRLPSIVALSFIWLAVWFYGVKVHEISETRSGRDLARMVNKYAREDTRIVYIRSESFPYYVSHPVREVPHPQAVQRLLQEQTPTIALVKAKHVGEIREMEPTTLYVWHMTPSTAALVANFPLPTD